MLVILLILLVLGAMLFSFVWLMSPLAMGFGEISGTPKQIAQTLTLYELSYFIGLPALVAAQIVAIWQAARRHPGRACLWSGLPLLVMIAFAGWLLAA